MSVRAKFTCNKIESTHSSKYVGKNDKGHDQYEKCELRTLHMAPVYSNNKDDENRKFWEASPSGGLTLGIINQEAWKHFQLGKEYYLDFTEAPSTT